MPIRPILLFPDKRLRSRAVEVTEFDKSIRALAEDMLSTMYDAPGIGLAANQIGVLKRIFVMDCTETDAPNNPRILINPSIIWSSEVEETSTEGCLSFPEQTADVSRPDSVEVKFQDVDGEWHQERFEGIEGRCAQHEIDHLNGKLFIEHLSLVKRRIIIRNVRKLQQRD